MTRKRKIINLIQSIDRALNILELLANSEKPLGVIEISQALGLKISTTHNILRTLMHRGYVEQDGERGKYQDGYKTIVLANKILGKLDLKKIAEPYIDALIKEFNETVFLGILRDGQIINLIVKSGNRPIIANPQPQKSGSRLHSTAMGKVLIAFLPEEEIDRLLDTQRLTSFTEHTLIKKEDIKAHLKEVREKGVAFNRGEETDGVYGVAAPIRDFNGNVIGGLCIGYPEARFSKEYEDKLASVVKSYADEISLKLGYTGKILKNTESC